MQQVGSTAPTYCALVVATRLLLLAVQVQLANLLRGHPEVGVSEIDVVGRLLYMIRAGVCQQTKTLNKDEMPDLSSLLNQLPPSWRRQLIDAIIGEQAGRAMHDAPLGLMLAALEVPIRPLPEAPPLPPARGSSLALLPRLEH